MDYTAQITSSVACLHIILFLGADPKIIWNLLVKHKKETRIKELENKTLLFGYFSVGRLECDWKQYETLKYCNVAYEQYLKR